MRAAVRVVWTVVDGRPVRVRRVEATTAGTPLVLIHGIACSSAAFGPLLTQLAGRPRRSLVLAADMPGYGRSGGPRRALDIRELADWHVGLLDAVGVARAHIVGNSMGCQVALALARRAPARVASVVLVGPTTGDEHEPVWRYTLGLVADSLFEPLAYNLTLAGMFLQMGLRRYLATMPHMFRDHPIARGAAVPSPTLVVRGRHDWIIPESVAARLVAALPRARLVQLPRVAHALQFARPGALCDVMLPFMHEHDAPPGQGD